MFRAVSASLAAHLALMAAMVLVAATRAPVRITDLPRSVRLVASLEPPPAARTAAPAPAPSPSRVTAPAPAAPRPEPVLRREPRVAVPAAAPAPIAVPKVTIPVRGTPPPPAARTAAPPAERRPVLGERLAGLLAEGAPQPAAPSEPAAPRVASLAPAAAVAPAPAARSSAPAAAGPDGLAVSLENFPFAWYGDLVKKRVFEQWRQPSEMLLGSRDAAALVAFRIDRAGRVSGIALRTGSGSSRFDRSAVAAVRALAGLPPLPPQYHEDTLDVVISFRNTP